MLALQRSFAHFLSLIKNTHSQWLGPTELLFKAGRGWRTEKVDWQNNKQINARAPQSAAVIFTMLWRECQFKMHHFVLLW